ncbi:MAG: PIN domain-containing protein [Burkholderiaceae bacterium]
MKEIHVLLDFENVQPSLEDLAKLAPNFTDVWLFYGSHQLKQAQQLALMHDRVTLVPISKSGNNSLDFHLTFYLGYVAAKHPDARLIVMSNDKGYDPMIVHAKILDFTVQRIGFKVKKVPIKKVAVVKSDVALDKAADIKKTKSAKKPAATKKVVPVKKAVPDKKVTVKKPAVKKVSKPSVQTSAKVFVATDSKILSRIKRSLTKMADKRPPKLKSFKSLLKPLLGTEYSPAAIDAVVEELKLARIIETDGDKVYYK